MKKTYVYIIVAILVAVVGIWVYRATRPVRTISVSGECITSAPKDRTAITLRVTTLDKSAAVSMRRATQIASSITDFAKNIDGVKMQTTDFNSYEKSEWNRELQKSETLGVETTIALEFSADNIDKIEKILNEYVGTPNVYSENLRMFTSSEAMKPIMENCLGVAIKNARARADALASGDGHRAGRMLSVAYNTSVASYERPVANFVRMSAKMESADAAIATGGSLVSKDTEVSLTVSAVFEIK